MSATRMRPTFELETRSEPAVLMSCIQQEVASCPARFEGQFAANHAMISIHRSKRHFWSPWLHLDLRLDDGRQLLCGRFSPHPSIWTGFMFAYLALAVICFFAVLLGVSQQLTQLMPWAYSAVPVCLLLTGILWIAAQTGQRLAGAEMTQLKSLIERCIDQ